MGGIVQTDQTYKVQFVHKKRSGATRTLTIHKGKVSGNFTPILINQDNTSPIPVDIIAIADDSIEDLSKCIYEISESGSSNTTGGNS